MSIYSCWYKTSLLAGYPGGAAHVPTLDPSTRGAPSGEPHEPRPMKDGETFQDDIPPETKKPGYSCGLPPCHLLENSEEFILLF